MDFEGEGVIIGFAPGVPQPSWLSFPETTIEAPTKTLDFSVYANAQAMQPGRYDTSLRLLTGFLDGSDSAYVDIPITFVIAPTPTLYDGSVSFSKDNNTPQLPPNQTLQLDLGQLTSGTLTTEIRNLNSEVSEWLALTVSPDNQAVELAIKAPKPAGFYQGEIFLSYEVNGGIAEKSIPVDFTVATAESKIFYAVPPAVNVNESNEFIIRGIGFLLDTIQDVSINATSATAFSVVSDSEIRAQFASISNTGEYVLNVTTANGQFTAPSTIRVKQTLQAIEGMVEFPTGVLDFEFDDKRNAVVVATQDMLYRVELVNGSWETVTQRALATTAIELTPDANHIIYADESAIYQLDASTLETSNTYTLPYINISSGAGTYRSVSLKSITNNGDVLLVLSDEPGTNLSNFRLSVFHLPNQTLTITEYIAPSALADTDTLRRNAFIPPGSRSFSGFYNASTQTFEAENGLDITTVSSNRFAYSGNGQRLYMGNSSGDKIYDSTLSVIDAIPFDSSIGNYTVELSQQGDQAYLIEPLAGLVHILDIANPPYRKTGTLAFPTFFVYSPFPKTQTTPDNSLLLLGSSASNSSNSNYWLVFVPL